MTTEDDLAIRLRPELLRQRADDFEKSAERGDPLGMYRSAAQMYRACADRISELEDTIDVKETEDDLAQSYGRNTYAASVLEEIASRRGKDWPGAKTLRQVTSVTRDHLGNPYCDDCQWFHPPEAHDPVCTRCRCAHEYHRGDRGECTNGAHGWSCDCPGYQPRVSADAG